MSSLSFFLFKFEKSVSDSIGAGLTLAEFVSSFKKQLTTFETNNPKTYS